MCPRLWLLRHLWLRLRQLALCGASGALLAACSLAPPYHPDQLEIPAHFKEAQDTQGWRLARPADDVPRGAWWSVYGDLRLDALEQRIGAANPDFQAGLARLEQARALFQGDSAALFPQVNVQGNTFNARASTQAPFYFPVFDPKYQNHILAMDVSYEFDFWGKLRNTVASGEALAQASGADLATLELSLRAQLVSSYFTLRGLDQMQSQWERRVAARKEIWRLTKILFEGGAADTTQLAEARSQWQQAQAQAVDNRLQRAQMEHAVAVLVGENPASFSIEPDQHTLPEPPGLVPGLSSTLLQRRPDVAAAERRMAAANARIGVARAAFFPDFTLNALVGLEDQNAGSWFTAGSRYWSLGPSFNLNLFDAGLRAVLTAQARAAYDETAADYRHVALAAFREVEDGLVGQGALGQEREARIQARNEAERVLEQARLRLQAGVGTAQELEVARAAALESATSETQAQVGQLLASVRLIKALGGGWNDVDLVALP